MRIAIVNDLGLAVEALKRIVTSVPDYDIAWVASDGREAVEKCQVDIPDVILMDLVMPVMDGIEATGRIMAKTPCAILIVTASIGSNAAKVFEAMGAGALDAVKLPALGGRSEDWGKDAILSKLEVIASLLGKVPEKGRKAAPQGRPSHVEELDPLVVIGASTGGPKALLDILSAIPKDVPASLVVIQHVDSTLAGGLAGWLKKQTGFDVKVATRGSRPSKGVVLMAGTGDHLIMTSTLTLDYTKDPIDIPYRPSVDVFFNSVADHWPEGQADRCAAVLLTGMGHDGAIGMKRLWEKGWHTIAEDAKSCVVYGMPKAAVKLGVAKEILPVDEIAPSLMAFLRRRNR